MYAAGASYLVYSPGPRSNAGRMTTIRNQSRIGVVGSTGLRGECGGDGCTTYHGTAPTKRELLILLGWYTVVLHNEDTSATAAGTAPAS